MPDTSAVVLGYLARGWPVVPIVPGQRQAYVKWTPYQTSLPSQEDVQRWLARWPDASWGVVHGAFAGIVCVDVDARHGGFASLATLEVEHGELSHEAEVWTPGGTHLHFAHPGGRVKNTAGVLAPGIDVKGDGALVPMPPSTHPGGGSYEWCEWHGYPSGPLPLLPAWWAEQIVEVPVVPVVYRPRPVLDLEFSSSDDQRAKQRYIDSALRGELDKLDNAEVGTRNNQLNLCAFRLGQLVDSHGADRDVLAEILTAAGVRVMPDELPRQIAATVRSGMNKGMVSPRRWVG